MKTNQWRSLATVGVLWLALGMGCRKDPTDLCKNGECCGLGKVRFVRKVEGDKVGYGGGAFMFEKVVSEGLNYNQASALTCLTQQEMIKALHLKSTQFIYENGKIRFADSTHAYPYRVWGTLYNLIEMPGIAGPIYSILLEKVEPAD